MPVCLHPGTNLGTVDEPAERNEFRIRGLEMQKKLAVLAAFAQSKRVVDASDCVVACE